MASVINVINTVSGQNAEAFQVNAPVYAGTVGSILPGYLVIVDGSHAGYVKAAADGASTSDLVVGVACSTSTETASADGVVSIISGTTLLVGLKAKTPANLVSTMKWTNKYVLDVTSGSYTLDQGTTSNGIFTLVDYDDTTNGNCIAVLACNKFQA